MDMDKHLKTECVSHVFDQEWSHWNSNRKEVVCKCGFSLAMWNFLYGEDPLTQMILEHRDAPQE
jgi:hypothetical protein